MSLTMYTIISIVVIVMFIGANVYYGLPLWSSAGLMFSLVLCVRGLV
jgi:hypothetical protein